MEEKTYLNEMAITMGEYEDFVKLEHEKDISVFNNEVLPLLTNKQKDELELCMEDTHNGKYRITDKPCSISKDKDYELINVYINQWRNGGYTGDDYAGTISIELPNGQYFTYDYEC